MRHLFTFLILCALVLAPKAIAAVNAKALVEKADEQQLGKTFRGQLYMTIKRPDSERKLKIISWLRGHEAALIKVLEPAKEKGTGNLRVNLDLWQYLPKVERLVKIPPSLMLQSWMGSDFTNDDLVKTSSTVRDYTHKFIGYETLDGTQVAKIECQPKPNAPVVWGRLELWIDPKTGVILRQDFFSEKGEHLKRLSGRKIKTFGTHTIASEVEMQTIKKNTSTTLEYIDAVFDEPLGDKYFSQNFLKSPLTAP